MIRIFLLISSLIFPIYPSAQVSNLRFEKLVSQDYYSVDAITCIFEDHRGFIWIGAYNYKGDKQIDECGFLTTLRVQKYLNPELPEHVLDSHKRSLYHT